MSATGRNFWGGRKAVKITAFMLCAILLLPLWALAHTPGAPRLEEVKLEPIYVMDGDRKVEITLDNFKSYYSEATGGKSSSKSVFTICAYRAVQKAFTDLWGEETPNREDIQISSALPIPHSLVFLHMVAVGDPPQLKEQENLRLIRKEDSAIVENLSFQHLENLSQSASYEDFEYQITRRATGKTILLTIDEDAFGTDYLSLWKKAIFSAPETMTDAEELQYSASYKVADKLIQLEDHELFSNVSRPLTLKTFLEGILGIMLVGGFLVFMIVSNIAEFRRNWKIKRQSST
jgi:hypothetical protein